MILYKVPYHNRKSEIDFAGFNRLGIREQKEVFSWYAFNNLSISVKICMKLYHKVPYHKKKPGMTLEFFGLFRVSRE